MNLNDLLQSEGIDPECVLVLRHRPFEPGLRKVLPWLAGEKPDVFNAYQSGQPETLERAMNKLVGRGFVASLIGMEPGKAVFVGLYSIAGSRTVSSHEFDQMPANIELKSLGMEGGRKNRTKRLWFDLRTTDFYSHWKGKLTVTWPPPERSWWRRAHRNVMPIHCVLEESLFDAAMPNWDEIVLTWEQLRILPTRWKSALSHWRGIYFIHDDSDDKGYVGSAYGESNLLSRWLNYAARGHGGNVLLKKRDPSNFQFSILQRVSPDMNATDVIRLEATWKQRLHTHAPGGLNEN